MLYHISYDLRKPNKDYTDLYKAIKELGAWCHVLDSTWYIDTAVNSSEIINKLRSVSDNNDAFVVTKAKAPGSWYGLSDEISTWLKNHLEF